MLADSFNNKHLLIYFKAVHKRNQKWLYRCHLPAVLHVLWFVHTDSQFDL